MPYWCRLFWPCVMVMVVATLPAVVQAESAMQTIVLGVPQNTLDSGISAVVLREAYWRLGYDLEIRNLPAERALMMSSRGEVDGELQRIAGLSTAYPDLVQVVPAINFLTATAFSHNRVIPLTDWESVRPYRLGIIRGIKFSEISTAGMNREIINDYPNAFQMLRADRVDLVLAAGLNGRYHLRLMKLSDVKEIPLKVPNVELFHYLHIKHKALAVRLGAVLEKMKASGEIDRIQQHVTAVLLKRAGQGLPSCDANYRCFELELPGLRQGGGVTRNP